MPESLTVRVLTQSMMTILVRVLAEDDSAVVSSLDSAPLPADAFGNQRERVRVAWEGQSDNGTRDLILYALPDITWSERVNPRLPAPAPVLFVESDLPEALTMLTEGFVASGRRRDDRPAWLLRDDWTTIPTLAEWQIAKPLLPDALSTLLEKMAAFHALHWGAERVLNDVYPWLPEFDDWVRGWSEERGTNNEKPSALREILAGMPLTLIHGTWTAEHLRVQGDELLLDGWDRLMVGPAAWDLACLLDSLPGMDSNALARAYCGFLKERVVEFEGVEAFIAAVAHLRTKQKTAPKDGSSSHR